MRFDIFVDSDSRTPITSDPAGGLPKRSSSSAIPLMSLAQFGRTHKPLYRLLISLGRARSLNE
jgi:hypothetical protein